MTNKEIKDKIIEEVNIVDVVSEYVQLEKTGSGYKGLCPFHNDSTPSFHISPEKKICKCFSCGEGGDVISFYQKINNISYGEAFKALGKRIGIEIVKSEKEQINENLFSINNSTAEFYNFYLNNSQLGQAALKYLHDRQINDEMIEKFNIGLAPNEFDVLYKTLTEVKKYLPVDLLELGLITGNDKGYSDLFRNRVIFPIKDEFHRVVGFSGRIFQNEKNVAKYINSKETILFKKSDVLYNLNNAKEFITKKNRVILSEGFMDVIAFYKAGIKEVVCSMGTALTQNHAKLLRKYTDNIIICYDGDEAGKNATLKAIETLNKYDFNISVVNLPNNLDPDEFLVKYGVEKFNLYFNSNIVDENSFNYLLFKKDLNLDNLSSIEVFKNKVFTYIKDNISSAVLTDRFLDLLAKDIVVSKDSLRLDFENFSSKRIYTKAEPDVSIEPKKEQSKIKIDKYFNAERTLIKFMIKEKANFDYVNSVIGSSYSVNEELLNIRDIIFTYYCEHDELLESDLIYLLDSNKKTLEFYEKYIKDYLVFYSDECLEENIKVFKDYPKSQKLKSLKMETRMSNDINVRDSKHKELRKIYNER